MKRLLTITILTILTLASAQQAVAQSGMKAQRFRGIQLIGPTGRNNTSEKNQGVALLAPGGITSSYALVLPSTNGSAGQSLVVNNVDGSNAAFLTWATPLTSVTGWVLAGNAITNPANQFLGTTNAQPLVIRTNNTEAMRITSDGELLIGTSTDAGAYDLQVSGDAYVAGKIAISTNGETQLISTFKASGSPGGNIFIGAEQTPTWGSLDQGSYNTSLGSLALDNLTSGYMNTAVGRGAMTAITGGYWNTALGYQALNAATNANLNVAIGNGAMRIATNSSNTAIGGFALQSGSGYNNTAVGAYAGSNATITGYDNALVGFRVLDNLTSGSQNVVMGSEAARYMATTNQSVILGASANPSADGTTNEIVIGYNATGLGSNSVLLGNSSITATRLQGRVGVGMSPTGASNVTGLFVRAGSSQSTNTLFEAQNNAGTALVSIGSDGAITGSGGATLTGATNINTTGTAATTIGNTTASTAVTINSGSTGRLKLGGLTVQSSTSDDILLINSSDQVSRITKSNLVNTFGWGLSGNSGTDSTANYIGTTDEAVGRPLIFRTDGAERMRITGAGAVLVGTTSGTSGVALEVVGGNIRIATNGDGQLISTRRPTNFSSAADNIFIGGGGQNATWSAGADGQNNTSLGSSAMNALTTGNSNTAVGTAALRDATTGNSNTAVGNAALIGLTSGGSNSAFGSGAVMTTSGSSNTGIGSQALRGSATLSNNTGSNNTAVGKDAGWGVSSGSRNTLLGALVLSDNGNPFTGSDNVAIGYSAAFKLASGTENIIIGSNAAQTAGVGGNVTNVAQSVIIGSGAKPNATTGESNQIVIGYNASGLGSNTAILGNSSITATRLQGRVGVGADPTVVSGDAQLQVTAAAAANRGLTITGAASQSANLLEVRNSSGSALMNINSNGSVTLDPFGTSAGNTNELRFKELAANGSNYVGFKAPDNIAANVIWTLPSADGTSGQVLSTNASGTLSWVSPSSSSWSLTGNALTDSTTQFLGATNGYPLVFRTNNTARMRITSDGNVGIGTATPASALHVAGTAVVQSSLGIGINRAPNYGIEANAATIYLYSGSTPYLYATGGNVAIGGSSNPGAKLSVNGNVAIGQTYYAGAAPTDGLIVQGNVGIGTASPGSALDVKGTLRLSGATSGYVGFAPAAAAGSTTYTLPSADGTSGQVLSTNGSATLSWVSPSSTSWSLSGNGISDASTQFLGTTSTQPLVIRTNNTEKLRITSDGEMLIGVTTDGGTYVVQTSGNVLVGGYIDVNTSGQSRRISTRVLSGTSGNNIFIGGGGDNLATTGDINDASNNVSLGVSALNATTTGRQNVAIGTSALQANTTGFGNIAIGTSALRANTTGYYNTGVGQLSLSASTTGLFNTAYGYGTLQASTTANDNVAVGFTAMGSTTTGASNVAVGGHALSENTTGAFNTAIGSQAGRYLNPGNSTVPNTRSVRSVYVGNDTRASDSTNTNEIVIGARARGSGSNTATIGDSTLVSTHLRGHLNLTYPATAATAPELRLYEATTNGSNYTALKAGAQSADLTYTLPTAAPTAGQVLSSAADGTMSWITALTSSSGWVLAGNSITDASTQFLGTTSTQPLVIRTNNTEKLRVTSDGLVLIGASSGTNTLDVTGTFGATGNATIGGTLDVTGLITGNAGLTVSGAATSINASSNFNTNINTGTSTGVTTIGNTGSTVTIGSIATSVKSSVGSNDRIVVANSSGTLDQASISAVVSAGVATNAWSLTGNTGTDSTTAFVGTTNETPERPVVFKTNGVERARIAGGSGYTGFGSNAPDVQVEIDGGLAVLPAAVNVTADGSEITVGNRSFIAITSNDVPGNRTITLTNGLTNGQKLTIVVIGSGDNSYGIELVNANANLQISNATVLLDDSDVIELIYYSGVWYETSHSFNDEP